MLVSTSHRFDPSGGRKQNESGMEGNERGLIHEIVITQMVNGGNRTMLYLRLSFSHENSSYLNRLFVEQHPPVS